MRHPFRFLLLVLLLALAIPAQAGTVRASSAQPESLRSLIGQFDSLLRDDKRAGRRDLWLTLEENFSALEKKSKGKTAATAAFYEARSRQELAKRSWLALDHREAAARFKAVADKYGNYQEAPEALYFQGYVLERQLNDHAGAAVALGRLIKSYPRDENIPAARKLLAEAQSGGTGGSASAAGKAGGKTAEVKTAVVKTAEVKTAEVKTAEVKAAEVKTAGAEAAGKAAKASSVTLKSIDWKTKGKRAVITLELDAAAGYDVAFVPPDKKKKTPGRLLLDIAGAFPSADVKPGMRPKNMVVTRIRTSHSGDGLRVTLDCDGASCYAVASPPGKPRIIQIEVSEEAIEGGVAIPGAQKGVGGKSAGKGRKKPSSQDEVMEQLGLTVRTIILDAGHGGKDPGALAGDIEEARFTLAMAKRIGALLKKEGFSVLYTRSGNKFISLQDRPDIANSKKADLFISIHANANPNPAVRGIETYFLDSARTQDAAVVAARENSVSVKNISDLQVILTDLMLSSKLEESRHLAKCVQKGLLNNLRAGRYETVDNGHRSAPFYVLMGARMPAVLVEFGYITNKDDAENMRSERYLQLQAAGVVDGIKQYKNELSRIAGK